VHRFFVEPAILNTNEVHLPVETSHQIDRVLRLKTGDSILLLDNLGNEFIAELLQVSDRVTLAHITTVQPARGEPLTKLTMMVCLTQREKFEMILQKCTEIGVSAFLPVASARSLVQRPADVLDKYPRWNKIIKEAAEQSERGRIPVLYTAVTLADGLKIEGASATQKIVFWENEEKTSIKSVLRESKSHEVVALIGPEGGWTDEEVAAALKVGFVSACLGKRILRMETAAMVAAELVIYELG
jgi:16S rRNA (uracil1498-N3)-methyltransferase